MKVVKMINNLTSPRKESKLVGYWPRYLPQELAVPIYHVDTIHELNRLIGYAKFKNGSVGTVLYRGQNKDFNTLIPSGARPHKSPILPELVQAIIQDDPLCTFFQLNDSDIDGWKEYQQVIIESVIQHYGGNTYCMDFVDNHWCALWFGLYQFNQNHYCCRKDEGKLYIYLYVADTNGASVRGLYIGEDTYIVDLRKAVPSTFQRPASQHGWVVRKKNNCINDCIYPKDPIKKCINYDDRVVGVIEVNVKDAENWLGEGTLLSEENFFPTFEIDQGYNVLLQRQYRSGLSSTHPQILPPNTICNYHLDQTFYCSDRSSTIIPNRKLIIDGQSIMSIGDLYSKLISIGWRENTSANTNAWDESNPWNFQSAPTALLVQRYFGGDIYHMPYSNRHHYYNVINGVIIDLTFQEVSSIDSRNLYSNKNCSRGNPQRTLLNNYNYLNNLFRNCHINDNVLYTDA